MVNTVLSVLYILIIFLKKNLFQPPKEKENVLTIDKRFGYGPCKPK